MTATFHLLNIEQIGPIVQFHRKKAGLSRVELAMVAGIGKTAIYDIEHGKLTVQFNTLFKVLAALNIKLAVDSPIMDLLEETPNAQR
ncbi:MAG: helix-turn-helix transcriptional regulator [Desulfosarcina sp.]|nr:helix-turn-helix transcriptional regulator [Desulfosarcina sp.]